MVDRITSLIRVTFVLLLVGGIPAIAGSPLPPTAEVGKAAPAFSLTDMAGTAHQLSDFKGKIVVLEWTNPNCPFVNRVYSTGIMSSLQKEHVGKGVVWLAINSTSEDHGDFETAASLAKIYTEWGAGFSGLLMDADGTVGRLYEAKTTPHMYIIDAKGMLVYAGGLDDDPRGNKSEKTNYVRDALDNLMAGTAVMTSTTRPYGCSVKY